MEKKPLKQLEFPFVRTPYNHYEFPDNPEISNLPSETIPDQSMPVTEIMRRFSLGLPINGQKVPIYEGEEYLPDLSTMDLADRETILAENRETVRELQKKLKKEQRETARKQQAESLKTSDEKNSSDDKSTKSS